MPNNPDFWLNVNDEGYDEQEALFDEITGRNMVIENGATPVCDSSSPPPTYRDDVYYSRSNIAQLSLHEPCAEELVKQFSRVAGKR